MEYVLETKSHVPKRPLDEPWEIEETELTPEQRMRLVVEAEEWERQDRKRQKATSGVVA